jgi:methanogenic corrinoid protein MtbC1
MLEGNGFEVIDLGVDVSAARFVSAVKDQSPHIVGFSALLTTTMPAMKLALEALQAGGVRDRVRVMVGGAPVTRDFAEAIGADAFGASAVEAVARARSLMGLQ